MTSTVHHEARKKIEHVDLLVVGAGLSGIGAGVHLMKEAPDVSFAILEARDGSGGTWDQFRYPGVRSDSDMFTLGYEFRPWTGEKSIAGGDEILAYLRDTSAEFGVDEHIRYGTKVLGADWSSDDARWVVTTEDVTSGELSTVSCSFLYLCSGYYRYDQGFTPEWPGRESFKGEVIHPQHWPADFDASGKKIVVVGSGATAVTLVPALTGTASHVTQLQRSPSFVMSLPETDVIANILRKVLSGPRAYRIIRWKNIQMATLLYSISRKHPDRVRGLLRRSAVKALGKDFDVDTHFNPTYEPWDQRMCFIPDGDLFAALQSGQADVVTDHIESLVPGGLRLRSGDVLQADVIVTATGLNLAPLGGIDLNVDGTKVEVGKHVAYKAMMLHDVPSLAFAIGYTNAPWTLKVDLVSAWVARLNQHMKTHGYAVVTPRLPAEDLETGPMIDMTSGYFERSRDQLPLQGDRAPWRIEQHYGRDSSLFTGRGYDDALEFSHGQQIRA